MLSFSLMESFSKAIHIILRNLPFFHYNYGIKIFYQPKKHLNLSIATCLLSTGKKVEKTWSRPQGAHNGVG